VLQPCALLLCVLQVDGHSMDVRIVHSFTANFDDPLEQVYKRAVAANQAAAAAAAAAGASGRPPLPSSSRPQAHGRQAHHQHKHEHKHDGESDEHGCTCLELQEEDERMLPNDIKRSAACVVHELHTDAETEHSAATTSCDESMSQPSSIDSIAAAAVTAAAAAAAGAQGAAASPFGGSPFQAVGQQPFSVPRSRIPDDAQQQQQQQQRHRRQQQQRHVGFADAASPVHGGQCLSVEVMRDSSSSSSATHGDAGSSSKATGGDAPAALPSRIESVDDSASESSRTFRQRRSKHPEQQQQPDWWSGPSSSGSERSSTSTAAGNAAGSEGSSSAYDRQPSGSGTDAVFPGPGVAAQLQQHTPVLVHMTHQHTAHGHEEVQVKALPRQGEARQQQQQIINRSQQQHGQQHSFEPLQSNPMDMHILHQPDGFVPLSSTTAGPAAVAAAASAAEHDRQQQQQADAEGLAAAAGGEGGAVGAWLQSWASSSTKNGTLIMPHQQQHQQYHHQQLVQQMGGAAMQQQQQQRGHVPGVVRGWVPRCEWELDPRKVLVGRRLAVGGFAEVFLGKYEVRAAALVHCRGNQ
jgi:ribosomal protein L12E/L44/L45/RPP1/RPP2